MELPTDIRVIGAEVTFESFALRTPLVLSTGAITGIVEATARVTVEDRRGRAATGYGAIFLGDLWAWPSQRVASPQRVAAMQTLCLELAKVLGGAGAPQVNGGTSSSDADSTGLPPTGLPQQTRATRAGLSKTSAELAKEPGGLANEWGGTGPVHGTRGDREETPEWGHPIVLGANWAETLVPRVADQVTRAAQLPEPIPTLAASVCFSPFDAALHDAYGRVHGISAYAALGSMYLPHTLDHWFGEVASGRRLAEFFRETPAERVPGWHLVSKGDALTEAEVTDRLNDGLPESLEAWIAREGMDCLKVKISGTDIDADVARTIDVYRVATETHRQAGSSRTIHLEVDSNEASPDAETVVEYLKKLKEASPEAFASLLFVEQPTGRDLPADRIDMRPVAVIKPVLVDEGLQSLGSLPVAAELGWSGAALKTCKGHSVTLLCVAWCALHGWPYAIVDLTNPGLSAIHAAVLAGVARPMMGLELNCRQFVPAANADLAEAMPGLSRMTDGRFDLSGGGAVGLGYPSAFPR